MEPLDWGDGQYARTAIPLAPAAEAVIAAAGVSSGDRVLDMACGTGNAALAAAARGATAVGVDLSERLVSLATTRAAAAGRGGECTFVVGDAADPPLGPEAFDVAVSVFGVIFAPDPEAAVDCMRRALRPGGVLALATWLPEGPVRDAAAVVWHALPPEAGTAAPAGWDDPDWVAALLTRAGLRAVSQWEEEIVWTAPSADDWFAEQEEHHPVWRRARRALPPERWDEVRERSIAVLRAGSDDPDAFRARGPYLVTRAAR